MGGAQRRLPHAYDDDLRAVLLLGHLDQGLTEEVRLVEVALALDQIRVAERLPRAQHDRVLNRANVHVLVAAHGDGAHGRGPVRVDAQHHAGQSARRVHADRRVHLGVGVPLVPHRRLQHEAHRVENDEIERIAGAQDGELPDAVFVDERAVVLHAQRCDARRRPLADVEDDAAETGGAVALDAVLDHGLVVAGFLVKLADLLGVLLHLTLVEREVFLGLGLLRQTLVADLRVALELDLADTELRRDLDNQIDPARDQRAALELDELELAGAVERADVAIDERVLEPGALLQLHVGADEVGGDVGRAVETDRDLADPHRVGVGGRRHRHRTAGDGLRRRGRYPRGDGKRNGEREPGENARGGVTGCSFQNG